MRRAAKFAGWVLAGAAAACSGEPPLLPGDAALSTVAPVGTAADASSAAAQGTDGSPRPGAVAADPPMHSVPPPGEVRLRTAVASGPFGDSDLWIGAGPPVSGLQQSLGAGDVPGPLMDEPSRRGALFRVYGMCGHSEADIRDGGEAHYRQGGDFASVVYRFGSRQALGLHRGCVETRFLAIGDSWLIGSEHSWFQWRHQAETWVHDRRARHASASRRFWRESTGLPQSFYWSGYGVIDSDSFRRGEPLGIVFAPRSAPVDEVWVVPESVLVRDGVLRGLVRNRSWRYWAYDVTVAADGHQFAWPLSVQPGEVAPFEIHGWDGPADPEQIAFDIEADLSWHADPSRAYRSFGGIDLVAYPNREGVFSEYVRASYPEVTADVPAGARPILTAWWDLPVYLPPPSRLSWDDDVARLVAGRDLSGYGALVDSHGRVIDVGPAHVSLADYEHEPNYPQDILFVGFDIYAQLAHEDHEWGEPGGELSSQVNYIGQQDGVQGGILHGGYVLWIGAAHPARAAE